MLAPQCRDVWSSSVPQHQVPHTVHTGLLTHLGAKGWLVALHLCVEGKDIPESDMRDEIISADGTLVMLPVLLYCSDEK